jgi:hypothetical protein
MKRQSPLAIIAVSLLSVAFAAGFAEPGCGRDAHIKRGIFAQHKLWVLSDTGELSVIDEHGDSLAIEGAPESALDLCKQNGKPVLITCRKGNCEAWKIWRMTANHWSVEDSVPADGDKLVGLSCSSDGIGILTSRRLIELKSGGSVGLALSDEVAPKLVASMLQTPNRLFVGMNAGEWGGGLRSVDRKTGEVAVIDRRISNDICSGPLNTACDPVNGVAVEPWKSNCLVAAIGLVHFMPHGRLIEVCGNEVRTIYSHPFFDKGTPPDETTGPLGTIAFFGLVQSRNVLWSAGLDGIYRIDSRGVVRVSPLPKFTRVKEIRVSFELPHLVIILTSISAMMSVSGPQPMIIAR